MLNRITPISLSDRIKPIYFEEPGFEKEILMPPSRYVSDRLPILAPFNEFQSANIRRPPVLPIVRTAKYRFIDAKTGRLVTNVSIVKGLTGLGFAINSMYGTGTFIHTEIDKTYTAKAHGYNSVQFRPVAGRTITVLMKKETAKTAQYKFVDGATGNIIKNITLVPFTGIKLPGLKGLGKPTYTNGIYTFPSSDINKMYTVKADNYIGTALFIKEHSGIISIKLTQKATVKFIDAATRQPIKGVTVTSGLSGLLGLGVTYRNTNGLFTFSFKPGEYSQKYTIKASGYKSKNIVITPGFGVKAIKLDQTEIFIKNPPINSNDNDFARRLRLAKAKAKARLRKIKLLAI